MKVILDGLSVLTGNWQIVPVILFVLSRSQFMIRSIIKRILTNRYLQVNIFPLRGGMVVARLVVILALVCIKDRTGIPSYRPFCYDHHPACRHLSSLEKKGTTLNMETMSGILFGLLGMSILLRLAFISKTITPLYFDSAQHYLYIKRIFWRLCISKWVDNKLLSSGISHSHRILSAILHMDIKNAMLVLGQMILAVIPISIFFMIKHETSSNSAGLFAVLLAGVGWYMSAHAMDWGKYPALTSLPLIQFTLSLAYLSTKRENTLPANKRWWFNLILAAGILISIFFHSRSLVVFGIVFLAWMIETWRQKLSRTLQVVVILVPIIGIIIKSIFIQRQDILKLLLDPYLNNGLLITSVILILFPLAIKFYPNLASTTIISIFILISSIFIPIKGLPGYGNLTLLDRPFVEMILYLPLSLLGGLGLAGLFQYIRQNIHMPIEKVAGFLLIGLVVINASLNYDFYPSDCCKIVGPNDLTAIDWMDKNLPADARILISTADLILFPSASSQGIVGADAGIWISPLINRQILFMPYNSNFSQRETLDILCTRDVNYIYVGEIGQTFDDTQIRAHAEWYKALLSMSKAGVYQVVGCDQIMEGWVQGKQDILTYI